MFSCSVIGKGSDAALQASVHYSMHLISTSKARININDCCDNWVKTSFQIYSSAPTFCRFYLKMKKDKFNKPLQELLGPVVQSPIKLILG